MRFGKNPYGILPVVDLERLRPLASDGKAERRVEEFIRTFAAVLGAESAAAADAAVPVLRPGDPDAAATLQSILELHAVSRRVEVGTVGRDDARAIGCAYVSSPSQPAAQYLGPRRRSSPRGGTDSALAAGLPDLERRSRA